MTVWLRYLLAPVLGIGTSVIVWMYLADLHPIFRQLGATGLIPPFIAGLIGGAVVTAVAPGNKLVVAILVGLLLGALLLASQLRHGVSHGARSIWLWYWPVWLPVCFGIGGALFRRVWRAV